MNVARNGQIIMRYYFSLSLKIEECFGQKWFWAVAGWHALARHVGKVSYGITCIAAKPNCPQFYWPHLQVFNSYLIYNYL